MHCVNLEKQKVIHNGKNQYVYNKKKKNRAFVEEMLQACPVSAPTIL